MEEISNKLVEKFIKLNRVNEENIIEVLFFKLNNWGNVTMKKGYVLNSQNYHSSKKSVTFLDLAATDASMVRVTTSKNPGEVYRNSIWFPKDGNDEHECLLKSIDLFTEFREDHLKSLLGQVSVTKKEIYRLRKLKEKYEEEENA